MSLVTPDFGLLFWMVLIFGIVLFILWKFGFPIITDMVEQRAARIENSLRLAREAEEKMRELAQEQDRLVEEARKQQAAMLKEATESRKEILEQAKAEARAEADKILSAARTEIAVEKESALREVRAQVAELSIGIAEKVLRKEMEDPVATERFVEKLTEEI